MKRRFWVRICALSIDLPLSAVPGSSHFKAEPVDQHGNLIDRHNLWEREGVRYRRAVFPGYSDTVQYTVPCSGALAQAAAGEQSRAAVPDRDLEIPTPQVPAPAQSLTALHTYLTKR